MELAKNYYKDAIAMGNWLKLMDNQEKIIALKAQIHDTAKKETEMQEEREEVEG